MPILEEMLASYPQVAIVLSTSWVRAKSFDFAKAQLSPAIQQRIIGATYLRREMNKYVFLGKPRSQQIAEDVERRKPRTWVALEDDVEGWPNHSLGHLVQKGEVKGLADGGVRLKLMRWLGRLCS